MRTAKEIIEKEVVCNVSSLVSTLASTLGRFTYHHESVRDLIAIQAQAAELAAPVPDYEEAAIQADAKLHFREDDGRWCVLDQNDNDLWDLLFATADEAAQAYCAEHDIDPIDREVFEHWIVTPWFADKLEAKGEKVDRDFAGLTIWARTTTGQAIEMDGVMQDIAAGLAREYG